VVFWRDFLTGRTRIDGRRAEYVYPVSRWLGLPALFIALSWAVTVEPSNSAVFVATGLALGVSLAAFAFNSLSWRRPGRLPAGQQPSLWVTISGVIPLVTWAVGFVVWILG
jgi:hypothetical protein